MSVHHHHPTFMLGQALEALAEISDAADLETALRIANAALDGIVPSDAEWLAVERGARTPVTDGGAGAPPVAVRAVSRAAQTGEASATPAPPSPYSHELMGV